MEIERKFLLDYLPVNIDKFAKSEIIQAYISYEPELRIRKKDDKYFMTKKIGTGMVRNEYEMEIDEKFYNFLINGIDSKVSKTRYLVPLSSKTTAEIDVYHNNLDGLKTVEVEFETMEEAMNFEIPNWFGLEVTNDKDYKNANLSKIKSYTKKKI